MIIPVFNKCYRGLYHITNFEGHYILY